MNNAFCFKTLADFLGHFKDEETCKKHFTAIRFRDGEYCAHCGHKTVYSFSGGKRYRCAKCRQDFTIKTNTVFGDSKLTIKKWFIDIYLLTTTSKGISSVQLAKHVGVTQKTAWFMDHRIRSTLKQNNGQLFGTVEVDETFVGGKAKNMHAKKRREKITGTGGVNKTAVVGLLQRGGEVRANVTEDVTTLSLEKQIVTHAKIGSQLYTDEAAAYSRISKIYPHEVVRHAKGDFKRDEAYTNSIESFWAIFKRGYHGVYHQMSRRHLQRSVDEFAYRFNHRGDDSQQVFSDVVEKASLSVKLPYKNLTHEAA